MQTQTGSVTELAYWLPILAAAPFVGSFLGVLVRRLPEGRAVCLARSACEYCGVTLQAREMVPLASYLLQRGKCRHCGMAIDPFHVAIEFAALGVPLWAILAEPNADRLWLDCLLGWTLLTLGWIDWRWMRLPDALTLPLLLAGLLSAAWLQPESIGSHATGAAVGYLALRGVAWCYHALRGREGIGAGDAKLLAAAGAWLGLAPLPMVVLLAALLGLATAGVMALSGRKLHATTALPFGPCLAASTWLVWLYGAGMVNLGASSWSG